MDSKVLEDLGLTKNEVKVYLAMLELGSTPAGRLIKKVGMHRAAVYDIIDLLAAKGLVSYIIKANRKYFEAQDPDMLSEYIDSKKQELDEKEKELAKIIPELQLMRTLSKEEQEGNVYKGKKGLKSVFEDIIKERKPWFVFGATGQFKELFHAYFIHFHNRRANRGIPLKILFNEKIREEKREKELKKCEMKYLPEAYITPTTTYVYSNKTVIIVWSTEPMAFLIRSEKVAESYKTFFDLLWGIAKK